MWKRWSILAVTVTVCALTGCSGGTSSTSKNKPNRTSTTKTVTKTTTKPTTKATTKPADRFVTVVKTELPAVAAGRTDQEIRAIGDTACDDLAAGGKADVIVATTRTLGTLDAEATDQATARELVKLAIDTICLDQSGRVDEF
ncbi:DUF732 domain-containing protein [Actinoplanes utahensis]|uniref:DUF732 domain-containing protein n=1 Tax=Actinoplanes utahensis TaxID=1869 RepID=A0A0A6X4U5_ACTUT|nr:DUF732 domain-containing protein [Actinoplanes utahensis]KHD75132.1 hypothetical protein MB27_24770 [Actinoplanes utahensis]GIF27081.1 hypothetical protein Aut01nite_00670 [Actinoplanes utahensis]